MFPQISRTSAPVIDLNSDPREENSLIEIALWSGACFLVSGRSKFLD
jgi:hypothetical protein